MKSNHKKINYTYYGTLEHFQTKTQNKKCLFISEVMMKDELYIYLPYHCTTIV